LLLLPSPKEFSSSSWPNDIHSQGSGREDDCLDRAKIWLIGEMSQTRLMSAEIMEFDVQYRALALGLAFQINH